MWSELEELSGFILSEGGLHLVISALEDIGFLGPVTQNYFRHQISNSTVFVHMHAFLSFSRVTANLYTHIRSLLGS